jgi:hypothetical protein
VALVLLILILVIMLQSLFRNESGETLLCELMVLNFFFERKVVLETIGMVLHSYCVIFTSAIHNAIA